MAGPNALRAGLSTLWALRVTRPGPGGSGTFSHERLSTVLSALAGREGLGNVDQSVVESYVRSLGAVDPATLTPGHALALWINLYNALAIVLALETEAQGASSVLEIRSGFDRKAAAVGGEQLTLNDIEHGKIRRYRDPRIHAALVCGSLSCPTLWSEPFDGARIDEQLDQQMRSFVAAGGAIVDRSARVLHLSRIFLWFGSDFVKPQRMPLVLRASSQDVGSAVSAWMDEHDRSWVAANEPAVRFRTYDWGLGSSVAWRCRIPMSTAPTAIKAATVSNGSTSRMSASRETNHWPSAPNPTSSR